MQLYKFGVNYTTRMGKPRSMEMEFYAPSQTGAKKKAVEAFQKDGRRAGSQITEILSIGGTTDVTNEIKVTVVDTKPCLTREQVETVMAGNVHRANEPFPVGSVVHIKQGLSAKDLGVYKVRASFVDNAGNSSRTLEREGYRPQGGRRYLTTAIENLPAMQQPRETVEYKVLYPDDRVFTQGQPNTFSSYGLDQLVQIKITKVGGKIIRKEIV